MPTYFMGGLVGLFISALATITMGRFFLDLDTMDRKINEPSFKVGKDGFNRRLGKVYYNCRHSPVPYVKWSLKNERINLMKFVFPIAMLTLVALFIGTAWIMIKR